MLSQDYRNLLHKESKIYAKIQKALKKQKKYFDENWKDLYENWIYIINIEYNILKNEHVHLYPEEKKNWKDEVFGDDPMEWFRRAMWIYEMIEDLQLPLEKVFEHWYKRSYRKFSKLLKENAIDYYKNKPSEYAKEWWELNLSNYKWAISYTTKWDVVNTLKNGIDNHLTIWEIQKEINQIDERLFGLPRARAIAVTETTKAYEYGNLQPIRALEEAWITMEKRWLTVWDERVRPTHQECQDEWWMPIEYIYPSVWVGFPPWWVNCRCTIQYHRKR